MKVLPLWKAKKLFPDELNPKRLAAWAPNHKAKNLKRHSLVVLTGLMVFPAGTPSVWTASNGVTVVCWQGKVNHFHGADKVPAGYDPNGLVVALGKALGASRKAIREFFDQFPPVDRCVQAFRLRQLVRHGD